MTRETRDRLLGTGALALVLTAVCVAASAAGLLGLYRAQAADVLAGTGPRDSRVVVVGIDARTLDELNLPWPWPRQEHALLINKLRGASVVLYDAVLSPAQPGDAQLAAAMRSAGNVVLAAAPQAHLRPGRSVPLADHVSRPTKGLAAAAVLVGHASVQRDPGDGVVRTLPLVVEDAQHDLVPSLSLAAVMRLQHQQSLILRPSGVQVGGQLIPTGRGTAFRISYSDSLRVSGPAYVSAADVLAGRGPDLQGKVVLVGAVDPTLGDVHLIPGGKAAGEPGVLVHANALNTMLTRSYLRESSGLESGVWVLLLALVAGAATRFLRPWGVVPVGAVAYGVFFLAADLRYSQGVIPDLVYPTIAMVLAVTGSFALRYLTEERARTQVAGLFAQYVPDSVVDQLLASGGGAAAAAGQRAEVSVLFCDLRGFTALAATLEPAQVKDLLDIYYRHATDVVLRHGGTLLQFVGDEVFAVFGVPTTMADHADRALACARDLVAVRGAIAADLAPSGVPALDFGIGLHSGEVVAAHVGTDRRRQYGVVGTTVNVGARLCSLAERGQVVLSAAFVEQLTAPVDARQLKGVKLKGVPSPVHPVVLDLGAIGPSPGSV